VLASPKACRWRERPPILGSVRRLALRSWFFAPLAFAIGCDLPSVEDDLTITAEPAIGELQVDTRCTPACTGSDEVGVQVAYASGTHAEKDIVQFEQYRVDYTLHGVSVAVPFFASKHSLKLQPGAQESVTLQVVGDAQRAFVLQVANGRAVNGSARLQLAGYDFDNRHVFIDTEFDVRFEDLKDKSGNTDAQPDAGAGDVQ
jgi:hypothetical protein